MPRGGRRAGAPGQAYPNRKDLSVNKGPTAMGNYASGLPYGQGQATMDAQRAMPVSSPAPPQAAPGPDPLQTLLGGGGPAPGSLGEFGRTTDRPDEPITHGLPSGPGAGPEIIRGGQNNSAKVLMQQLASSPYASDDVHDLLNLLT